MKTVFIVFALIVISVTGLVYGNHLYQQRHEATIQAAATVAARKQAEANLEKIRHQELVSDYDTMHKQCLIGLEAYNQLAVPLKAKLARPDCDLSFK